MADNKTKQLDTSVEAFINDIDDEARREDCRTILGMMQTATGLEPKMCCLRSDPFRRRVF